MYEHKFVRVELSSFKLEPKEDYHTIILQYEKEGWELVQIFAPGTKGYGTASYFEIIFKRKKD